MKIGILISGSGSNMIKLIESCQNSKNAFIEIVISNNPDAKGIEYAKLKNIKTKVIDHKEFSEREDFDNKVHEVLLKNNVDFLCNAGFMRIHGEKFVEKWFNKHLNIHPSLLPKFKGLNTFSRVIKNKEIKSGCTVHFVNEKIDNCKIIVQKFFFINEYDKENDIKIKTQKLEYLAFPESIIKLYRNN